MRLRRVGARSKPPIVRSPSASTPPSTPSVPCSPPMSPESSTSRGNAMPQVSVTINGRQFRMACEEGEEEHLAQLAEDLDNRIARLRARFGEVGDKRLTVMGAVALGDEMSEVKGQLRGV